MSSYIADKDMYCEEYINCPEFLERYLAYMKNNQGKRPLTLSDTALVIREHCQYVHYRNVLHEEPPTADAHKDMGITRMALAEMAITQDDFLEYVAFLENVAGNTAGTLKKKLSVLRKFYAYLCLVQEDTGVQFPHGNPVNGIRSPSVRKAPVRILSMEQLSLLLEYKPEVTEERDRALMLVMMTTGITISELSSLKREDMDGCWLRVRGKHKDRYVYLTEHCQDAILRYLHVQDVMIPANVYNRFLFTSARNWGCALTPRTVRNVVIRAAEFARLQDLNITPRTLRDTVAEVLYEVADDWEYPHVSAYLGYEMHKPRYNAADLTNKVAENPVMQDVVERSSLASLSLYQIDPNGGELDEEQQDTP